MKKIILGLMICILIGSALGEVMISEIMYDPKGDEDKKEWIELYNNGNENVNLTGWKIKYGTTSRALTLYRGDFIILPDYFIILAKDGENFSNEYPAYSGSIIESTFSLSNSGKDLYLLNGLNEIVDNVTYSDIANEDYSIEINISSSEDLIIKMWIQGQLKGNPGNIINNEIDEIPEKDNEDDDTHGVPEFGLLEVGLIILIGGVVIMLGRNTS
jgi:hypothetical protein